MWGPSEIDNVAAWACRFCPQSQTWDCVRAHLQLIFYLLAIEFSNVLTISILLHLKYLKAGQLNEYDRIADDFTITSKWVPVTSIYWQHF